MKKTLTVGLAMIAVALLATVGCVTKTAHTSVRQTTVFDSILHREDLCVNYAMLGDYQPLMPEIRTIRYQWMTNSSENGWFAYEGHYSVNLVSRLMPENWHRCKSQIEPDLQ